MIMFVLADPTLFQRDCSELAQRILRLEQVVFPSRDSEPARSIIEPNGTHLAKNLNSSLSNQDEEQQITSHWLEGLLTTNTTSEPLTPAPLLSAIFHDFPTYGDAKMLLDHFIRNIDALYRILHIPTTRKHLEDLYSDLDTNKTPQATRLAFFLSVFAGSVYVSKNTFQFQTAALQNHSQIALAELWANQAVSLATRPPLPPSIEALQAIVNLAHLCAQIEGISGSVGILSISGVQMAKLMKIHLLDSPPYCEERRKNGADMVEIEVKRRIWFLSYVSGLNEGTYMLHPRQMETRHPSNVEDNDIPSGITYISEESYNLPLSSPTSMTYFLCRIQVATLVREVVDCLPPSFFASPGSESPDEFYDKIITLDLKYQQLLKSLPIYFQLTIQDVKTHQALLNDRPYLQWQRYLINFVIHTHRARLHRPFLIRGSIQEKFANSRIQCIKSAKIVIEIRNSTIGDHSIGTFTYVLHHFLMATIILAMDICFNPESIEVSQRKEDVLRACRELEAELNAKKIPHSRTADEGTSSGQLMVQSFQKAVQSLRAILRRRISEDGPDKVGISSPSTKISAITPEKQGRATYSPLMHKDITNHMNDSRAPTAEASRDIHKCQPTPRNRTTFAQDEKDLMPPTQATLPLSHHEKDQKHLEETHSAGDLVTDELWDEFFTVGSTFNNTDWDTFLLDVGDEIGGMQ
ncbi:hypothetical protein MferCBS31731_007935 [Microsporum ferrugineum]